MSVRLHLFARSVALGATLACGALAAHAQPAIASRTRAHAPAKRVRAVARSSAARRADAPETAAGGSGAAARAPVAAPLTSQPSSDESAGVEADEGITPQAEVDPLTSNGLGSPLCRTADGAGGLSSALRRNCETSGFVASGSQTSDLGIDVHIDTGVLGLSSGGLLATVQDLLVTPLWMAVVWSVHALLVMLEWCFTLDLLDSASVDLGLARGLRAAQSAFTVPWLATVLAAASMLTAYNGLIRRRVAETLGQSLLMVAMMVGGFWVMLDPTGTVGALGAWSNEASLGALAATTRASPSAGGRSLADGMGALFTAAIEVPWCYLEFGDVAWCREPDRLDPRLRAAAIAIAAGASTAKSAQASARLLRAASTNGAIFMALPANGSARNSINDRESLLRAICQSEDATKCRGPAAAEAEFRTNRGTWPRLGGLLLILVGVLGMLMLFGFIALRLLTAALLSLLYLMLAPVAVLTPALGESGRAAFRKWGVQLLGSVVAKLLFSFLLGAVLVVLGVLSELTALGWWTQWLLMSAFWWTAFVRRNQFLQFAGVARTSEVRRETLLRRASDRLAPGRPLRERVRGARERRRSRSLDAGARAATRAMTGSRTATASAGATPGAGERRSDGQARRLLDVERSDALGRLAGSGVAEAQIAAKSERLERIAGERVAAAAAGDTRRASRLALRGRELSGEVEREREELAQARRVTAGTGAGARAAGEDETRTRFLDAQAALPSAREARRSGAPARRDYAGLAGLAGHGAREFRSLDGPQKRAARVAIDRELELRKARPSAVGGSGEPAPTADSAAPRTPLTAQRTSPQRRGRVPARSGGSTRPVRVARSESPVMRDAREVEAGRKRQLGYDRP